jgi:hypothetical protein
MMKLKADVGEEMDDLIYDSLQYQCSLDRFIREYEPESGSPSSGGTIPSPSKFEHVATPRSPQDHLQFIIH